MVPVDLHITRPEQLQQVLALQFRVRLIKLDLPGIDAGIQARIEHRLASMVRPCGCTEGAIAMTIALMLVVGLAWLGWPEFESRMMYWFIGISTVVSAALVGRGVGVLRGRAALRHFVEQQTRLLKQAS